MKFQVTEKDILNALEAGGGSNSCPIALRLRDEFDLGEEDVSVDGDEITIKNKTYTSNKKIQRFIDRYDEAAGMEDFEEDKEVYLLKKVKPISFDLPIKQVTKWDFEFEDENE